MVKKIFFLGIGIFCFFPSVLQSRSFDAIFPRLSPDIRSQVFSSGGFIHTMEKNGEAYLLDSNRLDPRLSGSVINNQPSFRVESLLVVPQEQDSINLLAVYNALGKIRSLKGRLYHSATKDRDIPLFEDATRIAGEKKNAPIPDPGPASSIPPSETVYLRIKDVNFGNSFYRGDLNLADFGISYRLSNFKNLSYLFVPVIREEKFVVQFYIEPIAEGVLFYSVASADVSDFVSSKIDMPSAITKRLAVIISWIVDGLGLKSAGLKP
jgi:hypothetical protein